MGKRTFARSVFINCPFDTQYWPILETITFTIIHCGYDPICALLEDDSGEIRVARIARLIKNCKFGIHDISRVEMSARNLPRFNMPFELGMDLGCRYFGSGRTHEKRTLILDSQPYRYQKFLSDIAGQDIKTHRNHPDEALLVVREWLRINSRRKKFPGPQDIRLRYGNFRSALPALCQRLGLNPKNLSYFEYVRIAEEWLATSL